MKARRLRRGEPSPHGIRGDGVLVDHDGTVIDATRWSPIADLCKHFQPVRDGSGVVVGFRALSTTTQREDHSHG